MSEFYQMAKQRQLKHLALGSTALSLLLMAATPMALGQPAAGSLPGGFTTNAGGTTYTAGSTTSGTIAIPASSNPRVLQWGGTVPAGYVGVNAPAGITANTGFSIGSGASLGLTQSGSGAVLLNDRTGSPSQIYGALNASGVGGPVYIANGNGVIVGGTGTITGPANNDGVGLLGYAVDSASFSGGPTAGTITINSSTAGTGEVTVMAGATMSGSRFLIAGNGAVNVGTQVGSAASATVLSGYGFTVGSGNVTPTAIGSQLPGTSSVLAISGGSGASPLTFAAIWAGGALNNSGTMRVPGNGTALSAGKDITNTGIIQSNAASNSGLTINAGSASGTAGNFRNDGVINMVNGGYLYVNAANIYFGGNVQIGSALTSATNALRDFHLLAGYGNGYFNSNAPSGVVDVASTTYAGLNPRLSGQAIRILSGGIYAPGAGNTDYLYVGSGTATDPFFNNQALNYNLSLFPGTTVNGGTIYLNGNSATTMNLDGVVSTLGNTGGNSIYVTAKTINQNNGTNGGFALRDGGQLNLTFYGNVNNPNGAAANGSTAFQYNYVPITVANTSTGGTGSVTLNLAGPSFSSGNVQLVNLLVQGNLIMGSDVGNPPTLPTTPAASYANNHLVVQSTGNISFASSGTYYWPGLFYMSTVASAANPTVLSSGGSITLGAANGSFVTNLNNVIGADLNTPDVDGQTGQGGMFFMTNNLNKSTAATVTISNDSWVNFASAAIASAFQTSQGTSFFGAVYNPTPNVLQLQQLPAAYFQPK